MNELGEVQRRISAALDSLERGRNGMKNGMNEPEEVRAALSDAIDNYTVVAALVARDAKLLSAEGRARKLEGVTTALQAALDAAAPVLAASSKAANKLSDQAANMDPILSLDSAEARDLVSWGGAFQFRLAAAPLPALAHMVAATAGGTATAGQRLALLTVATARADAVDAAAHKGESVDSAGLLELRAALSVLEQSVPNPRRDALLVRAEELRARRVALAEAVTQAETLLGVRARARRAQAAALRQTF